MYWLATSVRVQNVWIVHVRFVVTCVLVASVCCFTFFFSFIFAFGLSLSCHWFAISTCWRANTRWLSQQIARQNPISEWKIHTSRCRNSLFRSSTVSRSLSLFLYRSICLFVWLLACSPVRSLCHSVSLRYRPLRIDCFVIFQSISGEYVQWLDDGAYCTYIPWTS